MAAGMSTAGGQQAGKLYVVLTGTAKGFQSMMAGAVNTAKMASMAIVGAATAAGTMAMREFAKFDQAMTESTSIMAGVTEEQKKQMADLAKTLSKNAKQSADELAQSYYFLVSAGLDAKKSMAALPAVMEFATAGAFDMSSATSLLADAQSALGMTSADAAKHLEEMTRLSDVLVKANILANASVEQFSQALTAKAGAAIKTYNKSVEEGVAVLAAYAGQGVKANLAGESLNRLMAFLSKGAIDNAAAHRKYGLEVFDSTGKMRNLADIIEQLTRITGPMSDEMRGAALTQMGFAAESQGVILPLLGTADAIREYQEELENAGGVTKDVADKQMQSFSNQMLTMWNTIKVAGIEIGEVLAPEVQAIGMSLKNAMSNVSGFSKWLKTGVQAIRWFFGNWQKWIEYGVNFWILEFGKMFNDFVFFFTDKIPWLLNGMVTMWRMTFRQILSMADKLGAELVKAMLGEGFDASIFSDFGEQFSENLRMAFGDAPQREATEWEKQQRKYLEGMGDKLGQTWNDVFGDQTDKMNDEGGAFDLFGMVRDKLDMAKGFVKDFFGGLRTEAEMLKQYLGVNEAVRAGSDEYYKLLAETKAATVTRSPTIERGVAAVGGAASGAVNRVWEAMLSGIETLVDLTGDQVDNTSALADADAVGLTEAW